MNQIEIPIQVRREFITLLNVRRQLDEKIRTMARTLVLANGGDDAAIWEITQDGSYLQKRESVDDNGSAQEDA